MKKKFYKILTLSALLAVMLTTSDPAMASTVTSGDGEKDLQGLIDSMPYGIDDYAYGKNPGMVGDSVTYAEFFNAYTDALAIAGSGTSMDEEKSAAYDKLVAAMAKVKAAIVPITDGTYYITTANTMFTDTMAWFAPYAANNIAGWTKLKPNTLFMWSIKKMDDGNFSMQNVGTGLYVNHCANIDQSGSPLELSSALETEQVFTFVAPNGQFSIRGATSTWSYNTEGHSNGAATSGPLASWVNKAAKGECAWRLCRVSDAELAAAQARLGRDVLPQWLATFADNYSVSTDPGYYDAEAHAAYITKVNEARAFVKEEHTDAEYTAMCNQVMAAKAHLDSSINKIKSGYYSFSTASYDNVKKNAATGCAWKMDDGSSWLGVGTWDTEDPRYIWKVTDMGGGKYSVQNFVTQQYINSSDLITGAAHINTSAELTTPQIISQVGGAQYFTVTNQTALDNNLYYNHDTENTGVVLLASGVNLYMHYYSDDEAQKIKDNYGKKLIKDSLAALCQSVEDKYIGATYSIDLESPIVKDTTQLFCNNKETTEGRYEYLLDGVTDDDTKFFHSSWSGTTETLVNENDYLRVYDEAGLPDPLVFRFTTRYQPNGQFCPKKMVISVSNDTANWKQLTTLESTVTAIGHDQYISPAIFGTSGYKYLKIEVLSTPTNGADVYGHPFFCMTEFNVYKMKQSFTIAQIDANSPVVTDASQLYCNNMETSEGKYEYLLDGVTDNDTQFFHSSYSGTTETLKNEYDYLRVYDEAGLPDPLVFRFNTRYQPGAMLCPKDMEISVSNDASTWTQLATLVNATAVSGHAEYTSPAIYGAGGYKYFKMEVRSTPTNWLDAYKHPYFCMTEFNIYKMKETGSEEETEALVNLNKYLMDALAHINADTYTSADIANMQKAVTDYLLVRKDTSDLEKKINTVTKYIETAEGGEDLFTFPQENIDKMLEVLDQTTSERPFGNIKQARVAELDTLVTRTYNELRESMHGPDPDTWYSVLSADQKSLDRYGNSIYGQHAWMGGLTSVDGLGAGDDTVYINIQNDPRSAWQFKPTDEPGKYYMVNCGSGWPENNGPVLLSALGEGQFSITTGQNFDMIYNMFTASLPGVPFTNQAKLTPEKNGSCAWTMEPASESLTYTMKLRAGSYRAMVLPYATKAMPLGTKGETVTTYNVCGYEASEDGKQISGIKLKEFTGETIPAGTPFVIKIDGDYSVKEYVVVDFSPEINSTVSRETTPVNGLTGTFSRIEFAEPVIVFSKDSAIVRKTGSTLSPQQAYLDMSKIVNDNSVTPDIVVPVSGFMENTVGIKNASVSKDKALVNVYTSDGVLIRKDVKRTDALKGLTKGVYIVGGEKKAVK